jgi:hypothetical protein
MGMVAVVDIDKCKLSCCCCWNAMELLFCWVVRVVVALATTLTVVVVAARDVVGIFEPRKKKKRKDHPVFLPFQNWMEKVSVVVVVDDDGMGFGEYRKS